MKVLLQRQGNKDTGGAKTNNAVPYYIQTEFLENSICCFLLLPGISLTTKILHQQGKRGHLLEFPSLNTRTNIKKQAAIYSHHHQFQDQ